MSLLRAELRRTFKRRITRWMLLLVVALMATVAIVIAFENQKPGPAALAAAEAEAEREFEAQKEWIEQDVAMCEEQGRPADWGVEDCQQIRAFYPSQEEMIEWYMPPTFEFRSQFPEMITVLAALLSLFAFIVGASMVGAEWRTGGMMNLLLWRPRRLQVLGTKLAALLATLLGLGVALGAAWTAAFWLVATYRGVTDGMTQGTWESFGLTGIRGITLALVAGTVGFALASFGRHTAMAMGGAIAAFVVGVAGVGLIAGGMLRLQFFERWLWTSYVSAWMDKSVVLQDWDSPCLPSGSGGECVVPEWEITWQMAGLCMAAVVVLVLGAATWQIRRRDVV